MCWTLLRFWLARLYIATKKCFSGTSKLRIFQSHYQDLGSKSVDDAFDEDWKQEVESKIRECCIMSSACEDSILDREIEPAEIARCLHSLKNNKTGGSDGLVGELLKYGGSGMVNLLHQLFSVVWHAELVPPQWREGLIVNLFKKGDKEVPGNYRGITLLSVVGKVFCKILNNRLVERLDKGRLLHEGQAGFRLKRSCSRLNKGWLKVVAYRQFYSQCSLMGF